VRRFTTRRIQAALAALVMAGAVGLAPRTGAQPSGTVSAQAVGPTWTMLVYMAADNNLELDALLDLEEMAAAANDEVQFVVLIDRSQGEWGDGAYPDEERLGIDAFTDTRLLHVTGDGIEVVQELGELDTLDPQNLAWFVWQGLENYPAERTGLVLWDHGGAALVPFGDDDDNEQGDYLSLPELQQSIGSALQAADAPKLDLIGFDACLMATVEVARAMAPFADVYVASQENEGSHGWDWTSMEVGGAPEDLAGAVVESFGPHAVQTTGAGNYTLSALDLEAMDGVDAALEGFVDAVERDPAAGVALLQARQQAVEFGEVSPDPAHHPQQVDLVDMISRLPDSVPAEVLVARNALVAAIDRAVVHNLVGPVHDGAQGLAIHMPANGTLYNRLYEDHPDPTGWRDLVKAILEGGSSAGGDPAVEGDLELEVQAEGWRGTMRLAEGMGAQLGSGTGIFGVPGDDGSALALALIPAVIGAGDPDAVQTAWNWDYVSLGGQPVSASITPMSEGFVAGVFGVYIDPSGQQTQATLSMELARTDLELEVGAVQLLSNEGGVTGPITPQPGASFAPLQLYVAGADVARETFLDPIDLADFTVGVGRVQPGQRFYASIVAYLPDGSAAARSAVATRP
jgi:hypothetical protein